MLHVNHTATVCLCTILGDPGTANLEDRMFEVKVYYVIDKSPWVPHLQWRYCLSSFFCNIFDPLHGSLLNGYAEFLLISLFS